MKVDIDEIIGTLNLIFGENNVRKMCDGLVLYKQDGILGYYDTVNDIQVEPKYARCAVENEVILCDNSANRNSDRLSFNDISMDTFNSAELHIVNSNYNCRFDYKCCMIKVPRSTNLVIIKSKGKLEIFHKDKIGAIETIDSTIPDSNIFIYGDPKFIVINYIKPNGEVVGITDDGEVGEVETLLRNKYPNIKVEKRGKVKTYTVETPDGTYYLNRLGNLY